jgi:hypothetical protein
VISKVERLDIDDQKQIAKMIEDEIKWDDTLKNTAGKLTKLGLEAIEEYKNGHTQKNDW